jgi:hypothetical protein
MVGFDTAAAEAGRCRLAVSWLFWPVKLPPVAEEVALTVGSGRVNSRGGRLRASQSSAARAKTEDGLPLINAYHQLNWQARMLRARNSRSGSSRLCCNSRYL